MFTRTRIVKRQDGTRSECHQLLESYRDEKSKPRHRVIASWTGPKDLVVAIEEHQARLNDLATSLKKPPSHWPLGVVNNHRRETIPVYLNARKRMAAMKWASRRQRRRKPRNTIQKTTQPNSTN